jgi:hypothetical protein
MNNAPTHPSAAIAEVLPDRDLELPGAEQRRDKAGNLNQAMIQDLRVGKPRLVPTGVAHA